MRIGRQMFFGAVAMAALTGGANATVLIQSTFDTDAEGWRAFSNSPGFTLHPVTWTPANGGMLAHQAPSDNATSFFLAPAAFVSALHGAINGSISYDIGSERAERTDTYFSSAVDVQVGAGTNRIRAGFITSAPGFPVLNHFSLTFDTSHPWMFFDGTTTTVATQNQIDTVLTGATSLIIRGEYWSSSKPDTAYLDNVVLGAIPEPETFALMLAGLGALTIAARRRKAS